MSMSLILRFKQPANISVSDGVDEESGIEFFRSAPNPKAGKWANVTIDVTDKDTAVVLPVALRHIDHIETISGVFCTRVNNGSQVALPAEYQNTKDALRYFRNLEAEHRKQNGESKGPGRPVGSIRLLEALQQYSEAKDKDAEKKGKKKSVSGEDTGIVVKAFIKVTNITHVSGIAADSIGTFAQSLTGHANTQRKKLKKLRAFVTASLSGDIEKYVRNNYDVPSNRDAFFKAANDKASGLFGKAIKPEKKPRVKFYYRDQLAAMRQAFPTGSYERVAMELYFQSGLRAAEGTHLLWANVREFINEIETAAIEGVHTAKNNHSYRTIKISDSLARILKAWRKVSPSKVYVLGLGNEGDPQDYGTVRDLLQSSAKKAGLMFDVDIKTFRSTHACECLWSGQFDLLAIGERLGHAHDGEVTLSSIQKYCIANPYTQRDSLNAVFGM
jgi:integrase